MMLIPLLLQAATPLAPTGTWDVHYAPTGCRMERAFGSGDTAVRLGIRALPIFDTVRLTMTDQGSAIGIGPATLTVEPVVTVGAAYRAARTDDGHRVTEIEISRRVLDALPRATRMTLTAGDLNATVAPEGMAAALEALGTCESMIEKSWGIDPAARAAVVHYPEPLNLKSWIVPSDFPKGLDPDTLGGAFMRWTVGVDGRIKDCFVIDTGTPAGAGIDWCGIFRKRGRYRPARDAKGKRVISFVVQGVN